MQLTAGDLKKQKVSTPQHPREQEEKKAHIWRVFTSQVLGSLFTFSRSLLLTYTIYRSQRWSLRNKPYKTTGK